MFYGGMAVDKNNSKTEEEKKVSVSLRENEAYIRKRCENCGDIVIRPMRLGKERKADCLMVYLEVATANMMLDGSIETVFLIARPEYSFLSSSAVKEIAYNDGQFRSLVPAAIYEDVRKRMIDLRNEL